MAKFFGRLRLFFSLALLFFASTLALAVDAARFDLVGPKIEVRVTRAGKTLPIAYVPNLKAGDKLWLHPDLPPTQSVHYLLVVAFLRGTTNPPPDDWFIKIETWNKKVREEGYNVTVPQEAQQAILFLAPETGGDFTTLRAAVRGRPGVFVRASQDLSEAGFEQARIEKYLASMRLVPPSDPKALLEHSNLLARTLNLKPNDECFHRPVDMQYTCLTQSGNQTLLDDGHAQNVIASLSNGSSSDFITAASYTSIAGGGTYSAYVGAVVDLVRIMGGLHTAQYQYIPAIAFPQQESLNLRLNTPPSFRNPKSVIVIGLPSIQATVPPPLRAADPKFVTCLLKPQVVLPLEGAPLVFSTSFAHDLTLHINGESSVSDVSLTPDAFQGGLVLDRSIERKALPSPEENSPTAPVTEAPITPAQTVSATLAPLPGAVTGTVSGYWGFDPFVGPTLELQKVPGKDWKFESDTQLIAGRENHLLLTSSASACIRDITFETASNKQLDARWKAADKPNLVDVSLPLKSIDPGTLHIAIHQFGAPEPSLVAAQSFSEPATLTSLLIHSGDTTATVTGTSLDQVQQFSIGTFAFTPVPAVAIDPDATSSSHSTLQLTLAQGVPAPKFKVGEKLNASFTLKDGRSLVLSTEVAPPRPVVTLLSKSIGHIADSSIRLGSQDDLPANQLLTFSLKSPSPFPRTAKIEVASADDGLHTALTVASGSLVLQNPHTILGTLDPLKTFGTSAFGPLRLRAVGSDGTPGDWIPLATLVRLPSLTDTRCTTDIQAPCTLTGDSLYLVDSVSTDPAFTNATTVPEGFVGTTLTIPRPTGLPTTLSAVKPANIVLYLRLRDDPSSPNSVTVPVLPGPPAQAQ